MKRKNYVIAWGNFRAVRHAWNLAIRETEAIAKREADAQKTTFRLTESTGAKDALGLHHIAGTRVWTGDNGSTLAFRIWLEE